MNFKVQKPFAKIWGMLHACMQIYMVAYGSAKVFSLEIYHYNMAPESPDYLSLVIVATNLLTYLSIVQFLE